MAEETRREKQRRALVEEILAAARSQLESGGPSAVSLRAISRAVGMSAPSLYTYFASLADLFTELIVESFDSLAAAINVALTAAHDEPLEQRLSVGPRAYRTWAITNPQRFNLVFTDQIIGYEAPVDGPTVDAQIAVLRPIAEVYAEACRVELDAVVNPGEYLDRFLGWWASFHGLVALEVNHHLDWVDSERIFELRLSADINQILGAEEAGTATGART